MVTLVAAVACGDSDVGEPLVSTTVTAQFKGQSFTPASGVVTLYKGSNVIAVRDALDLDAGCRNLRVGLRLHDPVRWETLRGRRLERANRVTHGGQRDHGCRYHRIRPHGQHDGRHLQALGQLRSLALPDVGSVVRTVRRPGARRRSGKS